MGPVSSKYGGQIRPTSDPFGVYKHETSHKHCRSGERCTGAGCVVSTGKTAVKRHKRELRFAR